MRSMLCIACAALLFAACTAVSATGQPQASHAPEQACAVAAHTTWQASPDRAFEIEAFTTGPNCRQSAAVLIIRTEAGEIVWVDSLASAHAFGLRDARTRADMQAALNEWIGRAAHERGTTARLPEWPAGSDQPSPHDEFPFEPESWIDRDTYTAMRDRAAPMFCYVQGMESLGCLIERQGRLEKIGVQSFPG